MHSIDPAPKQELNHSIKGVLITERSSSNPKTYKKNYNIDLNQVFQKKQPPFQKKVYQINTQELKKRQSDTIIMDERDQQSQNNNVTPLLKPDTANLQANTRLVKQIFLKKQNTVESLNSSIDQLSPEVKIPQSARNFNNNPVLNIFSLNNRISQLDSTKSESKLNQYFFPSQKLLSKQIGMNKNESTQAYKTYYNQINSNKSTDDKLVKKKIILRRDILNIQKGIVKKRETQLQDDTSSKQEIEQSESVKDLRKYEDESLENTSNMKGSQKPKTEQKIGGENEVKFKGRNMHQFQTQIIKKVPKNTPIKLEEGIIPFNNKSQEDISNLNLQTTTCSSGNEELSPSQLLSERKLKKIVKINKNEYNFGGNVVVSDKEQKTQYKNNILNLQINLTKQINKKLIKQIEEKKNNLQMNEQKVQNKQEASQSINSDEQIQKFSEEILSNQLGIFEVSLTENKLIKKLKILSQSEFKLYEAYQIKNFQPDYINFVTSYISAIQEEKKKQKLNNVLNYKQFVQNNDSSLLIFPFQANKTLKNLLSSIKLLNEQLVKIIFKDILLGLQQIYQTNKASLFNFLDFDQIFIDEKYRVSVGLNINQSKIDEDQIYLQYLSQDQPNTQLQSKYQINQFSYRDQRDIVQDFGFLLLKSLLGPSYIIFETNAKPYSNNSNLIPNSIISNNNYNKCCIFHDIKFISENNVTNSIIQLKKAHEISRFLSKNCSQQLQDILCRCLKYKKQERLNFNQLQQLYFQNQSQNALDIQQINNNQSNILKLLFQQVQIKEKQQDSLKSKTQKLQLLIRLKLVIDHSLSLLVKISPQINLQKIQEKFESKLSQYLSISPQEIKNVIHINR